MCFWGAAFVCGRHLSGTFHPFVIAFIRFALASCFFAPTLYFSGAIGKITRLQFIKLVVLGFTGVFAYNYFFFAGLGLVEAGKASVIIAINPIITAVLAGVFLGEGLGLHKLLGALFALAGATIVISQGQFSTVFGEGALLGKGELLLLGGVLSWVAYTLIGKLILKGIRPMQATGYSCFIGTAMLFPFAWKNGLAEALYVSSALDWWNFLFLGLFTTYLGFYWYYQGIQSLGAAKAAAYINIVPVVSAAFGYLLLGEHIGLSYFAGAGLVLLGIKLTQT